NAARSRLKRERESRDSPAKEGPLHGGVIPDAVDTTLRDCAPASPGRTVVGASGNSSLRREGSSLPAIFVASTSSEKFKLSAQARGLPANASSSTTSRGSNWCPVSQNSSGNFPGCRVTNVFTPRVKASSSSRTSGEIASHTRRQNSFRSGREKTVRKKRSVSR